MIKKIKAITPQSIRAQLSNLSTKVGRDFNAIALEFALERLVVRLRSDTKLAKSLVFKGGFVMLKAYGSNRLTVDVDTSLYRLSFEEAEVLARAAIEKDWKDGLWMGAIESQNLKCAEPMYQRASLIFGQRLIKILCVDLLARFPWLRVKSQALTCLKRI